jgi:hypothetical protein
MILDLLIAALDLVLEGIDALLHRRTHGLRGSRQRKGGIAARIRADPVRALHLRWMPGSKVAAADADAVVAALQGVTGVNLQPMLVEVVDVHMSPGARPTLFEKMRSTSVSLPGSLSL